jgi:hypothetical protein
MKLSHRAYSSQMRESARDIPAVGSPVRFGGCNRRVSLPQHASYPVVRCESFPSRISAALKSARAVGYRTVRHVRAQVRLEDDADTSATTALLLVPQSSSKRLCNTIFGSPPCILLSVCSKCYAEKNAGRSRIRTLSLS